MKRMQLKFRLVFSCVLVLLAALLGACSQTVGDASSNDLLLEGTRGSGKRLFTAQVDSDSRLLHHYLVGRMSYLDEDFDTAFDNYVQVSSIPGNVAPDVHSTLSELYVRRGDLVGAEKEVGKLLEVEPENRQYLMLYAGILEAQDKFEQAEDVYENLVTSDPPAEDAFLLLAALKARTRGIQQGVDVLNALLTIKPNHVMGNYYIGRFLEALGDLKGAESHFKRVITIAGADSPLIADLFRVLLRQKKYAEMKVLAQQTLELDPSNSLARRVMGEIAIGENEYHEALEHLELVHPEGVEDSVHLRFRIALLHLEQQDVDAAEQELRFVLLKDPQHAEARYYLASLFASTGRIKESIAELTLIPEDSEVIGRAQTLLAFLLRQTGEQKKAAAVVEKMLSRHPENVRAMLYLAVIYQDLDEKQRALALLERAKAVEPQSEQVLFQYGALLYEVGRPQKSMQIMEELVTLHPEHSDALNFLAYSLIQIETEMEKARNLIDRAIVLRPNDGYYLDTLGWWYFKKKEYGSAEQILSRAVSLTGGDLVVVDHLVQTLMHLGRQKEAKALIDAQLKKHFDPAALDGEQKEALVRLKRIASGLP